MEIILSPEEAHIGGIFPVTNPVMAILLPLQSRHVAGHSHLRLPRLSWPRRPKKMRRFNLMIAPDTAHGTTATIAMDDFGLKGVRLVIGIRVDRKKRAPGIPRAIRAMKCSDRKPASP